MPTAVHVHLQLRIVGDDGTVFTDSEILHLEKSDHQLEAVGLSIGESKTLQRCLQQHVVTAQVATFVDRHRCCPACGRHLCSKGKYPIVFRTVFGNVTLSSPLTELLTEHTAPKLLYLETRWASLVSFGLTADLLRDVLPVADTTNSETVRQHLHKVATRQDADLGTSEPGLRNDDPAAGRASPIPWEAVVVGIDGGYLRNWLVKKRNFEVIVGKSMAEDRDDRYFGLVRSQDAAPEHRLREMLRSQKLPVDQPVTVLTDGGDSVRALVGDLPSGSEHHLDWFRAT
ncbi:hypothetical protein GGE65_008156 [Skermanella aerolata]|uniref:hypothetical protein n=1 Tax=Skermanella aerolata TaxID=393310 RepID=UPI003D1A5D22